MDDEFVEACLKDSCYFRTVTVDLPRLDEKLVKTYLNFQLPEINPEPQSPGTKAIRGVGNEDKHLPWQISSNIEGTMCKICGSVQQTKHRNHNSFCIQLCVSIVPFICLFPGYNCQLSILFCISHQLLL